jgi:hypothetical protein
MGFRKTHLGRRKNIFATFTVYAVPPDGVRDIARYTIPFALRKKQSDHQTPLIEFYGRQRDWKKLHPDFTRILILVNQPGLNELSFKMTRLNGSIIYQFFRAVHTESK